MKSLMALGKLLILTVMLGSFVGCSQPKTTPYQSGSVYKGAYPQGRYMDATSSLAIAINQIKFMKYNLTEYQKKQQTGAVYSALESEYGQVFSWYDKRAMGAVKAVHGYPQGSGFCRVIFSVIHVDGEQTEFQETACKSAAYNGWRFQSMYAPPKGFR